MSFPLGQPASWIAISVLVVLSCAACSDPNVQTCEKMEVIAKNTSKIAYLKGWVQSKLLDREFLANVEGARMIYGMDDPDRFSRLGLDSSLLGIDERRAFVALNGEAIVGTSRIEPSSIDSVSIGEGRSSIVIILDSEHGTGIHDLENFAQEKKRVSSDVLVICR